MRTASSVEVVGDRGVALERGVRVFPDAEEVDLPADLLAPLAVVVRGKRERRVGLLGLSAFARGS